MLLRTYQLFEYCNFDYSAPALPSPSMEISRMRRMVWGKKCRIFFRIFRLIRGIQPWKTASEFQYLKNAFFLTMYMYIHKSKIPSPNICMYFQITNIYIYSFLAKDLNCQSSHGCVISNFYVLTARLFKIRFQGTFYRHSIVVSQY